MEIPEPKHVAPCSRPNGRVGLLVAGIDVRSPRTELYTLWSITCILPGPIFKEQLLSTNKVDKNHVQLFFNIPLLLINISDGYKYL